MWDALWSTRYYYSTAKVPNHITIMARSRPNILVWPVTLFSARSSHVNLDCERSPEIYTMLADPKHQIPQIFVHGCKIRQLFWELVTTWNYCTCTFWQNSCSRQLTYIDQNRGVSTGNEVLIRVRCESVFYAQIGRQKQLFLYLFRLRRTITLHDQSVDHPINGKRPASVSLLVLPLRLRHRPKNIRPANTTQQWG